MLGLSLGFAYRVMYPLTHPLNASEWVLSEAPTIEVSTLPKLTLRFTSTHIDGQSFVNSYSARIRYTMTDQLKLNQLVSTLMASTNPDVQAAESEFFALIQGNLSYQLENNRLKLCAQALCWEFVPND